MEVFINKEKHEVQNNLLLEVLASVGIELGNGTAVAINNAVVPRNLWQTKNVQSLDNILIIKATQGG
ncbi:MAG: sulfur carrier protein [Candidatus Azotimanducaceae bacterium]|jgi:sulfur carrier protein